MDIPKPSNLSNYLNLYELAHIKCELVETDQGWTLNPDKPIKSSFPHRNRRVATSSPYEIYFSPTGGFLGNNQK